MIPVLVLAAGRSARMGRPKAMLPLGEGGTFLTQIVRTFQAADVSDVVVVLGHEADAIAESLERHGLNPRVLLNPLYHTGQLSSVLAGLDTIDRPGVTAMLLTLVDVPLLSSRTVRAVMDRYRDTRAPIVRPVRGETHGHPVLIDRCLFEKLRGADPAVGVKAVVRAHASPAGDVPVDDDGAFLDIDTPEEYSRILTARQRPANSPR